MSFYIDPRVQVARTALPQERRTYESIGLDHQILRPRLGLRSRSPSEGQNLGSSLGVQLRGHRSPGQWDCMVFYRPRPIREKHMSIL